MSAVEDILLADSSQEAFAKLAPYDQALFCYRRFEFNHFGRLCRLAIDHRRTLQTLVNVQSARQQFGGGGDRLGLTTLTRVAIT